MKTIKVKRGDHWILQVRCANKTLAIQALQMYWNFMYEREGIKEEKLLYFNLS